MQVIHIIVKENTHMKKIVRLPIISAIKNSQGDVFLPVFFGHMYVYIFTLGHNVYSFV